MKKWFVRVLSFIVLTTIIYFAYSFVSDYLREKKHKEWVANLESSASSNVQILTDTILIDYLNEKRTLGIYLPENYESSSEQYPVIYFLDGQSLFDQKIKEGLEWQVDEVLDSLGKLNGDQSIVVGLYNAENRMTEYKPFLSPHVPREKEVSGDKLAIWIVNNLKPWVDNNFRTKEEVESTYVGGASLAGLMSYYMLMEFPQVFGGAIVFSPSFWVNDMVYQLHEKVSNLAEKKIYFNAGQLETSTVESVNKMVNILKESGMPESNLKVDVEEGEGHWHMTWNKGFKKAFPWIVQ